MRIVRRVLAVLCAAGLVAALPSAAGFAEGSRDLYPTNASCTTNASSGSCRANIEWRTNSYGPAAGTHILRRTLFSVYAEAGEVLEMGSSAVGVGSGDILVWNPGVVTDRDAVPLPSITPGTNGFTCSAQRTASGVAAQGRITSRAQELAGPQAVSGGGNPTGYVPCSYVVPTTGIYHAAFYGPAGDGSTADGGVAADVNLTAAGDFDASQGSSIAAWDLTVRSSTTSTANIDGRLFTYALAAFTGGNGLPLNQTLYVVTTDGYRYRTDTRGLDPNGYLFYGSRTGFLDSDGITPLNHDILGTSGGGQLTTLDGGVHLSAPEYPISFQPLTDETIGAIGIPTTPTTPTFTLLNFDGDISGNNSTIGGGGSFSFQTNMPGTYELIISRDGVDFDPGNPVNRVLRKYVGAGVHLVTWDGLDNVGSLFPVGLNYPVHGQLRVGEYHMPQLDAENSTLGGPTITLLNAPVGLCPFGRPSCTTAFYDDRGYQTVGGTDVGTPGAALCGIAPPGIDHADPANGYDSSSNQRAYGQNTGGNDNVPCTGSFGDVKGVDTWTYFPSVDDSAVVNILPGPPVATDDSATTAVNTPVTVAAPGVLANDTGDVITVTAHTTPSHGGVAISSDGTFTYTPDLDFSGVDTFTYTITDSAAQTDTATVTVTVTPQAVDDSATTPVGTPVTIDVRANDHGSSLTVTSVTQPPPTDGSVTVVGGDPVFTPDPSFVGTTTFTYTVTDPDDQTTTATVTVTVPMPGAPSAVDDYATTPVNTTLDVSAPGVRANDAGTGIHVTSNTAPAHGSLVADSDGSYTYVPDHDFSGFDSYSYTITDVAGQTATAIVHLTVTPQAVDDSATTKPSTPVAIKVLLNDHGTLLTVTSVTQPPTITPAHLALVNGVPVLVAAVTEGQVDVVDGLPVYTPPAGFSGVTHFSYTAVDSAGQTVVAIVTVTVPAPPAKPPVTAKAADDLRHGTLGEPVSLEPLENDTPSEAAAWDASTLRLLDPATGDPVKTLVVEGEGSWTIASHGVVTFTPENGFTGDPTPVIYSVRDSAGQMVDALITIDYPAAPDDDAPTDDDPTDEPPSGALPHTGAGPGLDTLWAGLAFLVIGVAMVLGSGRSRRRRT